METQITVLRQAQQRSPGDFWLNASLAGALSRMDRRHHQESIAFTRAALAIRPQGSGATLALGTLLIEGQDTLPEAIALLRRAIELDPISAIACNNLGYALFIMSRKTANQDEAIAWCRKAIEIDPSYSNAYNTLGMALNDQGELEEAIACYRKAIEINPKSAHPYNNLGNVLEIQNKLNDAIAAYHKAIELDPKHGKAHNNLGNAYYRQKNLDKAVACYRKAIKLDPKHANAYHGLGCALLVQNKLDDAIAAYRKALELDSKLVNADNNLGRALGAKGWGHVKNPDPKLRDPERAVEAGKQAVELVPLSCAAWQYLGWIQYRAGNWQAGIQALEKSCELEKGGDSGQWIVLALAHAKLAAQEGLSEKEREHHNAEALRRYAQADKQIDGWWRVRPAHDLGQAIWDFRLEARELMITEKRKK